MTKIFLYNTLTRQKEEFIPIKEKSVGLYTCGPTVYNYAHLGNLRAYLFDDFLKRILQYNGYTVKHVMNITDVGHLTGDMDMGEDKLELGAKREGKSAWEIARFYEEAFKKDLAALNIKPADVYSRATDNIPEQIALIEKLVEKGYTYQTSDGLYFDTSLVKDYNKLSHLPLEELKEGARVEVNTEKKNPTDFALWKFSPVGTKRQMEWASPWGTGFPGWHIECSAMSLKYLNQQLDIHCGGVDHINIHHTNEIAQSETATGEPFFNYWLHNGFLNIAGGKKMAKSADNFLTLENALIKKGINPLAFRFAALQVSYRKPMEYSETGIQQAAEGLESLYSWVASLKESLSATEMKNAQVDLGFKEKFLAAINDDLNTPQALAVLFSLKKSKLTKADLWATIIDFDQVFGLKLEQAQSFSSELKLADLPMEVQSLVIARHTARDNKDWSESDRLREAIKKQGYLLEDDQDTFRIYRIKN
ncbi:cysteine--tRNA ligase [Candidatus Falkowbacteria bacterium]|jgi:cysteinyl-tRNA synthetase|nr:cysteine--tRNA ligase [Candidatus Falkowbacteria bacterium]